MTPSIEERQAYVEGYSIVNQFNLRSHKFPLNPYPAFKEPLLWEAWEVGFNDAFDDEIQILGLIEEITDGEENSNDD